MRADGKTMLGLWIPVELKAALEVLAEEQRRTLSSFTELRLEEIVKAETARLDKKRPGWKDEPTERLEAKKSRRKKTPPIKKASGEPKAGDTDHAKGRAA